MVVFKCKLCGGTIELKENGVGICDSCGTKQTVPNTNDEKKMNLLDRANHFRMQNDFDKAMTIYEQILDEDTTDSDVYYSIALCRYGITYVDDPKSKRKIPTINRLQNKQFTEDADYKMAIKYAKPEQVSFYNEEGAYIDKVQQGIMDITKNEKPYDVFICYKETDDNGERTHDSVLANDLYYGLTNEGFKVFFARITLEGKLGTAYEPYIFSALNSSKIMVVIGTKAEYFNAVWVKNEWSRFLSLINDGANKTLIPAYKDMDPYDLPDEFANLQAQDMSKLGFMQDLIRGIKKILGSEEKINIKDVSSVPKDNLDQVSSLLRRAKIFLDDKDFKAADEYCEKVLDIDAENSDAYYYKLLSQMNCSNEQELELKMRGHDNSANIAYYGNIYSADNVLKNINFQKVVRYATDDKKKVLMDIVSESIYEYAMDLYNKKNYKLSSTEFEKILDYKDSKEKFEEITYDIAISKFENNKLDEAIELFKKIPYFKDSSEKIDYIKDNVGRLKKKLIGKKVKKYIIAFLISPLVSCFIFAIVFHENFGDVLHAVYTFEGAALIAYLFLPIIVMIVDMVRKKLL